MDLEQFARDEMISKSRKINNYEKLSFEVKRFQPKSCDIPKFQIGHKRNGRTASTTWLQEAAVLSNLVIYDMERKHPKTKDNQAKQNKK